MTSSRSATTAAVTSSNLVSAPSNTLARSAVNAGAPVTCARRGSVRFPDAAARMSVIFAAVFAVPSSVERGTATVASAPLGS
ncbi:hypothetical protein F4554_002049 [Actinopolymorpha rutila]|uniref:Uncharacterized protein n=1 Tax=Actinopolymorpha rutila TaxID=446787 RepID=A0A852Z8U1_9ACTN|nr:hypothetical protein [Actinopolymorpha rutila]